jgi:hypothetical protein
MAEVGTVLDTPVVYRHGNRQSWKETVDSEGCKVWRVWDGQKWATKMRLDRDGNLETAGTVTQGVTF